jgi:hypothetical protein
LRRGAADDTIHEQDGQKRSTKETRERGGREKRAFPCGRLLLQGSGGERGIRMRPEERDEMKLNRKTERGMKMMMMERSEWRRTKGEAPLCVGARTAKLASARGWLRQTRLVICTPAISSIHAGPSLPLEEQLRPTVF